jgi:putative ABC transport system substrate-binding protein
MRRRHVIAGLLVAAASARARAQERGKVYRIAIVDSFMSEAEMGKGASETGSGYYRAIFEELRRLGYVEGQNLEVERYSAAGPSDHYPDVAREVVRLNPDLINAAENPLVLAFKSATAAIPIVAITSDPIALGIVPSVARPGGNITGVSSDVGPGIWGKRVDLLRETTPNITRVGLLIPQYAVKLPVGVGMREAVQKAGFAPVVAPVENPYQEADYRRAFAAVAQEGADALIVSDGPQHFINQRLIIELAATTRLPAIYVYRGFVELGGLMAFGIDEREFGRHAGQAIGQILKGASPGEIPYYQASKFEFSLNLKTAKALGLTLPPSLLARADEVIE